MKELTIRHTPANGRRGARVSVSYRAHERAQPQTAPDAPFRFEITAEQRRLIQWYLEEHLRISEGTIAVGRARGGRHPGGRAGEPGDQLGRDRRAGGRPELVALGLPDAVPAAQRQRCLSHQIRDLTTARNLGQNAYTRLCAIVGPSPLHAAVLPR